jgi:hypothetical protein
MIVIQMKQIEEVKSDVVKLSELIPLSAAASGTMCGEEQLRKLRESISKDHKDVIKDMFSQYFDSSNIMTSASEMNARSSNSQVADDGYELFSWGGKLRGIPSCFKFSRNDPLPSEAWKRWWRGQRLDLEFEFALGGQCSLTLEEMFLTSEMKRIQEDKQQKQ